MIVFTGSNKCYVKDYSVPLLGACDDMRTKKLAQNATVHFKIKLILPEWASIVFCHNTRQFPFDQFNCMREPRQRPQDMGRRREDAQRAGGEGVMKRRRQEAELAKVAQPTMLGTNTEPSSLSISPPHTFSRFRSLITPSSSDKLSFRWIPLPGGRQNCIRFGMISAEVVRQ